MSPSSPETNIKMEHSQSLLLNEHAYRKCPDPQKNMFIYEWLRYLDRILPLTRKSDLKNCQQKLLEQLSSRIASGGCAQPSRILLGRCITNLFSVTDTSHLFHTINMCNDLLKDPSVQSQVKSTALSVLGEMYENLGRIVGRSYEETFQAISKLMKSAESASRIEILITLSKMIKGLGSGIFPIFKDLYKLLVKALGDRLMPVRAEAARCFKYLVSLNDSPLFAQRELDSICTLCIKALHLSNYEVRQEIANVFAKLAISAKFAQRKGETSINQKQSQTNNKSVSLNELLQLISNGMIKGGVGGFLKSAKTATGIQAGGQRETRVGIAEAYIAIATELGSNWLKRNNQFWCRHLLDLSFKCSNLPSTSDNFDSTVAVRRCIHFIFRCTIGKQLSELDQISTVKFLGAALAEYINSFDCAMDSAKEEERILGADAHASANPIIICLMEIGSISLQVDTAINSIFTEASGILEPIFSCLLHPMQSVRIATAWCLKCVVSAIPSLAVPLIDRCLNRLEYLKKSPEAISGFSFALAAIVSQSKNSALGIPFSKTRQIFSVTEELIKSATQTPRLMLRKVQSGWLLISAIISLGPPFIRPILPRLFTLWRISFPRSAEETKTERGCGDANSWEATLEARASALGSMGTLVEYCPELVNDELAKKISVPIETSLSTMAMVGDLLLMYGVRIRPAIQLLHLRLFSLLYRLPIGRFESAINPLLKELVAEITLSDNSQSHQRIGSSLIAISCSTTENTFLNGWICNNEMAYLEIDLNPLQICQLASFDSDPLRLLIEYKGGHFDGSKHGWWWFETQPLAVAALDSAIHLFARVFPIISSRCKLQLIQHFVNQLKTTKPGHRLHALQLNILTAICLASKTIGEKRNGRIDDEQLQKMIVDLVLSYLAADSILLKCLAAETLGRVAQAVSTPQFVASNAQFCFDKIRELKDESSRLGYALSLGTLHRFMGSLGSGQHLNTSIGILLALAQDVNCSSIKPWAIFSLSLIASTGGGMFCPYAEPVKNLCLQLLLNNSQLQIEVVRSIAKLIFALINAVGPELATTTGTMEPTRNAFLTASAILIQFDDPIVKADAITCYQYIHLFAPRFVELNRLVLKISELLFNSNIILRKSAVLCLHQLLQHEIKEVREHVKQLIPSGLIQERELEKENKNRILPENGLEGALFEMLDLETDVELRKHIKQSLLFLLQTNSDELLGFWLLICKDILASSQLGQENLRSTLCVNLEEPKEIDIEISTNDDDILQQSASAESREKLTPRWPTRIFAFEIIQKLLCLTETERAHLDLALAKELQMGSEDGGHSDYLVLHLSDLVRMGFMGATSENDNLRIAGLNCLQNVITKFAKVVEPEFPGHVLLEQFQAQIGAALRPAFSPETPGNVTSLACQVASTWICSGVARDLNDLRRIHQLLATSLTKLTQNSSNVQIYNENVSTLEKLSILRAWSKIYISAIEQNRVVRGENSNLLGLVEGELETLIEYWFAALRDFALLSLQEQFAEQIMEIGGTFFTPDSMEVCKKHYSSTWPLILLACTVWIRQKEEEFSHQIDQQIQLEKRLYMMIGICLDLLNRNRHYLSDERPIQLCLSSLSNLFACKWVQLELMRDVRMPIELMNVVYKLTLTRDNMQTQRLCVELIESILQSGRRKLALEAVKSELDEQNGNDKTPSDEEAEEENDFDCRKTFLGSEGEDGVFKPNYSLVFAAMEVLMCTLTRQVPEINLAQTKIRVITPLHVRKGMQIAAESDELIHFAVELLGQLPPFCCSEGRIVLLPSLLNLLFGVLRECSRGPQNSELTAKDQIQSKAINSAIKVLQKICSNCPNPEKEAKLYSSWKSLMRSALLSLLNSAQKSQNSDPDQSSTLLFAAIILFSSASKAIVDNFNSQTASPLCIGEQLFNQFCEIIRHSLHSGSIQNELKSIISVRLLFQCPSICGLFVRELGNDIFSKIRPFVANEMEEKEKCPTTQEEIQLIKETIKTIEAILATAKDDRKRIFVSLLVRSLVQFIYLEQDAPLNDLHEFALNRLNEIGCQHSEPFKTLLQAAPEIRERIETAIQQRIARQKESNKTSQQIEKIAQKGTSSIANRQTQPTIKLATDFANLMK